MFVVCESPIGIITTLALGDCQVEVVLTPRGLYIEKVCTFTGSYRLGVNIFRISILITKLISVLFVHKLII